MDEKNYKSIIQEYEELLTLVEVVKEDLPSIKHFQEETLSLITNGKKEISKAVENERKRFEEVLRKAILEIQEQEKIALDSIDRTVLEKAATAIDDLKKCEEGLSVSESKVAELTERFERALSQVDNATETLQTALQQLKNAPVQHPSSVVPQAIEIDYDEQLPVSEIYEKYSALNIPIIIQKTTWKNDYCMYVSEFDSDKNTAYGRVYLDGKVYRERSYISGATICQMYASPNEEAILAIEGGKQSLEIEDCAALEIGDSFDVNIPNRIDEDAIYQVRLCGSNFEYNDDADEYVVALKFEIEDYPFASPKTFGRTQIHTEGVMLTDVDDDKETIFNDKNEDDYFLEDIVCNANSVIYELRIFESDFNNTSLADWKDLSILLHIAGKNYSVDILEIYDIEDDDEPAEFNEENILYVYRGNIVCHRNHHNITNATGILRDKMGNEIEIDVEHCIDCDKYLISYDSYSEYRKQHGGILLGNIQMTSSGEFDADYDLAEESPLRLSGYTVNAQDNYSINERQFILATIIHEGIMSKHDVTRYLEHFLRVNGQKQNMGLAVRKWKEDLEFAKKYNSSTQPKVYLSGVKRYTK